MTRVQFFGDLAATGFGSVTMDLGRAMLAQGDDVRFVSLNETGADLPEPFASRTFRLGSADGWIHAPSDEGESVIMQSRILGLFSGAAWPDGWSPEAAIILGDFEAVRQGVMPQAIQAAQVPMFHYCPIEGVELPPRWRGFWERVTPVAMSEFGAVEIEKVTGTRPSVVYHGIDTEAFYPVSEQHPIMMQLPTGMVLLRTKADCKRFLKYSALYAREVAHEMDMLMSSVPVAWGTDADRIIMLRTDRHMPRKLYSSLFRAVAPVLAHHPDVDMVYHCRTADQGGNLEDAKSKFRPDIAARMVSMGLSDVSGGIDRKMLNALYNAADIYVSTSAEGFGLTIAEAMAAGVPAIGLGYSSVPEVIGATLPAEWTEPYVEGTGGLIVRPSHLWDNSYDHFWAVPDERAYATAVEYLVTHKKRRQQLGLFASGHVQRSFSWTTAARQFREIISERVAVAA